MNAVRRTSKVVITDKVLNNTCTQEGRYWCEANGRHVRILVENDRFGILTPSVTGVILVPRTICPSPKIRGAVRRSRHPGRCMEGRLTRRSVGDRRRITCFVELPVPKYFKDR